MSKDFLFATSTEKIKSHVVESQIALLVWPYLSLTEKQHTDNRMIIFNDSISMFYQSAFEISLGSRQISTLLSICLGKKNAEAIKFLGIFKEYVPKSEIYFCLKKISNVSFNKKGIFAFHTIFKLVFITQIIYCVIHRCLCSLIILFCSLFSF